MEIIFDFILKLVLLGLGYYLVNRIYSKNTKEFHLSVDQTGMKIDSEFYENQDNAN